VRWEVVARAWGGRGLEIRRWCALSLMRRNRLILTNRNAAIERPGAHYSIIYASLSIYPMPPSVARGSVAG
jgi:hypothetical protein